MRINKYTLAEDFAVVEPYVSDAEKERIKDAAAQHYCGEAGYWDITLSQLIELQAGEMPFRLKDGTIFAKFFLDGLKEFLADFVEKLNGLVVEPTDKELRAMADCKKMEFGESALIFARSYFGLPNFTEVGNITLGDFYLAKRDSYNKQVYDKASAAIARAEMKR